MVGADGTEVIKTPAHLRAVYQDLPKLKTDYTWSKTGDRLQSKALKK